MLGEHEEVVMVGISDCAEHRGKYDRVVFGMGLFLFSSCFHCSKTFHKPVVKQLQVEVAVH